ncbi:MobC family plasmid mobilization relaxosome protein [Streptomyces arenae]|nr:plasmid mobilization relaxosome protein MobC [Streptomyces arenae]MCG7207347.1 MobC family plasmid mobilization relaxosome protein [Streptomyces arenae]
MNDDEYQLLVRAANECHMSVAGFLARAALRAASDLNRTAAEIAAEREMVNALFDLQRHLSRIGNNINQVAKTLNSGEDAPHARSALTAVRYAAERVTTFADHYIEAETPNE